MSVIPLQFGFGFLPQQSQSIDPSEQMDAAARPTIHGSRSGIGCGSPGQAVANAHQNPAEFLVTRKRPTSDEQLLEAYLQGDRPAFQELMSRYSNELLHFLTRFLGSRAAAEDVFQETFLQIHLSAETFDVDRRFKPWLFTIAANKARDYHRKHNKRLQVSLSASIGDEGEGQKFVDLLEADLPSPDEPVLDAERSRLVKQVVDSMPPHLREILLLSYFQQMSYNQIAGSLEIPLGTVKSRLHTAVATFATLWKAARSQDVTSQHGDRSEQSGGGGNKGESR